MTDDKYPDSPKQIILDFDEKQGRIAPLMTPEDIFLSCDEHMLRTLFETEDRRIEKKSAGIQPRALGEYFSMWANTAPIGGVIAIGIADDKKFEGCSSLHKSKLNDLEKTADTFCPDARFESKRIEIHRDKDNQQDFVLLFYIKYHESRVVRTTSGKVFIRSGDTKREIKDDAIRLLQAEKGEVKIETESCGLKYPQDFDQNTIDTFVKTVRSRKGWSESHTTEQVLKLMHLGTFKGDAFTPNLALALLFANDPRDIVPGCRIRFLRFPGETEGTGASWNAVKDEFIDGSIPTQIQKAESILKSQLRDFSRLGKGGKFFTSSEYPEFAWYEAIVNACAHRSYGNGLRNVPIFVKMFDDRLVVESPGSFPALVTPQNIYKSHNPRNPYLMDAMFYLDFVKCANEGTRRIRDEMLVMQLPSPEFKQDDNEAPSVKVILRNNIKQRKVWVDADVAAVLGAPIALSLNENEKRCVNFAAEYGKISVSDAQRLTGKTWPSAKNMLLKLVNLNVLEHSHRDDVDRDPAARFRIRGFSSTSTPTKI